MQKWSHKKKKIFFCNSFSEENKLQSRQQFSKLHKYYCVWQACADSGFPERPGAPYGLSAQDDELSQDKTEGEPGGQWLD